MAKIKSKIYAKALSESVLKAKSEQEKKIAENFLRVIKLNGDEQKTKEIIFLTEDLLLKKSGNKKIILETARKTDSKKLAAAMAKKGDVIQEKISPELIAGVKITINGEKQLDFSLSNKLNGIF